MRTRVMRFGAVSALTASMVSACTDGGSSPPPPPPPPNAAPVITSSDTASVTENSTIVFSVQATDADGDSISYGVQGADAAAFSIDPQTGELRFVRPPDFERPADQNGDNIYEATVTASDGFDVVTLDLSVSVADVIEVLNTDGVLNIDGSVFGGYLGLDVTAVGDVDGDGVGDIVVAAALADASGIAEAGQVYLLPGAGLAAQTASTSDVDGMVAEGQAVRIDGFIVGGNAGNEVASAGDIDGDGLSDILVGTVVDEGSGEGEAYLLFGAALAANLGGVIDLQDFELDGFGVRITGAGDDSAFGNSVAHAGDFDQDGRPDILVGAFRADPDGLIDAGQSYVIFGSALVNDADGVVSADALVDAGQAVRLDGENEGDRSARSLSAAGDVDGDGIPDVLVGATGADPDGVSGAGKGYLVFGSALVNEAANGDSVANLSALIQNGQGLVFWGDHEDGLVGRSVFPVGDFDGDGVDDIAIHARDYDDFNARPYQGELYIVYTSTVEEELAFGDGVLLLSMLAAEGRGFAVRGNGANDSVGFDLDFVDDYDGDGRDDLLVATYGSFFITTFPGVSGQGKAYILYSSTVDADLDGVILLGDNIEDVDAVTIATGYPEGRLFGYSLANIGDIDGDGLGDIVISAPWADLDVFDDNAGEIYIISGALLRDAAAGDELVNLSTFL